MHLTLLTTRKADKKSGRFFLPRLSLVPTLRTLPILSALPIVTLLLASGLFLAGCSRDLYQPCRPTGSFFNPLGSGCSEHECLTITGKQAVLQPDRRGICTIRCMEEQKGRSDICPAGGVCNGAVCWPDMENKPDDIRAMPDAAMSDKGMSDASMSATAIGQ